MAKIRDTNKKFVILIKKNKFKWKLEEDLFDAIMNGKRLVKILIFNKITNQIENNSLNTLNRSIVFNDMNIGQC